MKRTPLRKRKTGSQAAMKRKADALWGQVIHKLWGERCAVCEAMPAQAHHLISRANVMTRHEVQNGILLCASHHTFSNKLSAHAAPLAFEKWLRDTWPELREWADAHKNDMGKPDYARAIERLQAVLNE